MNAPRQIHDHKVNPANDTLTIQVLDEPSHTGANHDYEVLLTPDPAQPDEGNWLTAFPILFQNGPINEHGVNGLTHEALIAILVDRLRGFQSGPFACRENAVALTKLEEAQMWLQKRTRDRMARGVEGTHQK